jgi:hypothetical protein
LFTIKRLQNKERDAKAQSLNECRGLQNLWLLMICKIPKKENSNCKFRKLHMPTGLILRTQMFEN